MVWGAGKAIENLWSYLGPKAKEDAKPCFEYDGQCDGWLPVYLDGVQVMFRDSDQSTPDILWRADKYELVKMQSDIANHPGVHVRYTTEIDAAWPDVNKCLCWGSKVKAEKRGSWLFMSGPSGPIPKDLWPIAKKYWEDLFHDKGIQSPGKKRDKQDPEVKVSLDLGPSKVKEPISAEDLRSRFNNLDSQKRVEEPSSSSSGPARDTEANRFAPEALKKHNPTRSIFAKDDSLEVTSRPLAPSDEEEWEDLSPSRRPRERAFVPHLKLDIARESAKAVELGMTGAPRNAEQDGTKHVSQTTQRAPDGVSMLLPTDEVQQVVSKIDTSSEMMAAASGPRPVDAQASSTVNHRGVALLSPVTPKSKQSAYWATGTPNSNLGDPILSVDPDTMAVRTGVPDTPPSDIAIRDEQMSLPPKSTFLGLIEMQGPVRLPLMGTTVPLWSCGSLLNRMSVASAGSAPSGVNRTEAFVAVPDGIMRGSSKVTP